MEWVEIVDQVAGAAAVVDRVGWAVLLLPALAAIASAPVAGIKSRMR